MILVSRNIRYMRIFAGVPRGGEWDISSYISSIDLFLFCAISFSDEYISVMPAPKLWAFPWNPSFLIFHSNWHCELLMRWGTRKPTEKYGILFSRCYSATDECNAVLPNVICNAASYSGVLHINANTSCIPDVLQLSLTSTYSLHDRYVHSGRSPTDSLVYSTGIRAQHLLIHISN